MRRPAAQGRGGHGDLTPVADYRAALTELLAPVGAIDLLLADALGATLAEDIVAAQPLPAVATAATDGYAIASNDVLWPVSLPVAYEVQSTERAPRVLVRGTAVRVQSGAPMPRGADAVASFADTDRGQGTVAIKRSILRGENVRREGFDAPAGEVLVPAGRRLGAREIGLAAAIGSSRLLVRPVPRVVVMAVGDDLDDDAREGVPDANTPMLAALVDDAGARAYAVGIAPDDPARLADALEDQVVRADVIVTTGGLSGGHGDTLPDVLRTIGEVHVTELGLVPRAHHAWGRVENVPVVCLPGHPVSALLAFEAYLRPALRAMTGFDHVARVTVRAEWTGTWPSTVGVEEAVPVVLDLDDAGVVRARPLGDGRGGVSLAALVESDGIAWVDAETLTVRDGDTVRCTVWDR